MTTGKIVRFPWLARVGSAANSKFKALDKCTGSKAKPKSSRLQRIEFDAVSSEFHAATLVVESSYTYPTVPSQYKTSSSGLALEVH
jgi:hypothetical protein